MDTQTEDAMEVLWWSGSKCTAITAGENGMDTGCLLPSARLVNQATLSLSHSLKNKRRVYVPR
jgi:hypothetical protein